MPHIRLVTIDDVPVLTELLVANREFLRPTDPDREERYFTLEGQREVIASVIEGQEAGQAAAYVVLNETGAVIGRIMLSAIVRGPLESAILSYWIDAPHNGKGFASAAVREMLAIAFDELRLHRVEAGTLPDNFGSQRVLQRNGFERFGVAPKMLKINGSWQDHVLFQVLTPHEA